MKVDPSDTYQIIILLILLALSAFFSSNETALMSVNKIRLRSLADEGNKRAAMALDILENQTPKLLSAILIGNNIVNISASSLATTLAYSFGGYMVSIVTVILTVLILIFGEITPKNYATINSEKITLRYIPVFKFLMTIMTPVIFIINLFSRGVMRLMRVDPDAADKAMTEEELRTIVDVSHEDGVIESDEKEMIENIFEFNNTSAEECMVHRKDITAIDLSMSEDKVLDVIAQSGLSRFPVYDGSIDNVTGILTARDFLINRCKENPKPFRELIRPAHFVPETVHTDVLFREMQTRKQHMSIVIDEYGGTSGLITMEDLLEEIVGNIYDEFDPNEEQDITPLPDGRWRVAGSVDLETLSEELNVELPLDEEYDTLGGLVFNHLAEVPADGARPVVECFGIRVSVTEIADRRVEWAIVEKLPEAKKEEDE